MFTMAVTLKEIDSSEIMTCDTVALFFLPVVSTVQMIIVSTTAILGHGLHLVLSHSEFEYTAQVNSY